MSSQLIYWSGTGITQRFAERLGGIPLDEYTGDSEVILAFPSYGSPRTGGYIPPRVLDFIYGTYGPKIIGIVGVGNTTFGADFCYGAKIAAEILDVPVVALIDMVPSSADITAVQEALGCSQ